MGAMKSQYGEKEGERVFYASKNKGKISGVDDDAQHMGITAAEAEPVKKLVSAIDALESRMDAFQWGHQRKPEKVKARTKDNMQPSTPHPKEPGG